MAFKKKTWVNVPDPSSLPSIPEGQDNLARFDAENMNRIETGIEEAFTELTPLSLHKDDESNPHNVTAEQTGALPITGGITQGNIGIYKKNGAPGLEFYTGKGFAILIKNAKNDVANPENNYDYGVLISDYAEETPGAGSLSLMLSYSAVEQNQFSMKSGLRLASIINGEATYYNIYGDHNVPTPEKIGAAPAYSYGTTDLTAGSSSLATGKLYFVYE